MKKNKQNQLRADLKLMTEQLNEYYEKYRSSQIKNGELAEKIERETRDKLFEIKREAFDMAKANEQLTQIIRWLIKPSTAEQDIKLLQEEIRRRHC